MSRKFPASFRVFRRGCWNCILRVQGNILTENSFISKFFFIFGHWATFLTNSCRKSRLVVQTGFSVLMETFGWKFFAKLTSCFCLKNERKIFGWLSEKSPRGFYAAFYVSMGTFWRKNFWKVFASFVDIFFQINSGNWAGKVWPACQNCIHCIYKIILKKTLLENKWIFSSFSDNEQEGFGFLSIFSTCMLELNFTCPKQHFNEEQFYF